MRPKRNAVELYQSELQLLSDLIEQSHPESSFRSHLATDVRQQLRYAPELIQDVVMSVADKMKGQFKQLEDERLALGRDSARWNSEIRKTSALIRPNETDSPAIARLADLQERIAHNERQISTKSTMLGRNSMYDRVGYPRLDRFDCMFISL